MKESEVTLIDRIVLIGIVAFKVALLASPAFGLIYIMSYTAIVNNAQQPSRVDMSPIAALSEEQVERAGDVIAQFQGSRYVSYFRIRQPQGRPEIDRTYRIWFHEPGGNFRSLPRIYISVTVVLCEETAISTMQTRRDIWDEQGYRYTHIVNHNNTEAELHYPHIPGSRGEFLSWPTGERNVYSYIRIGAVVIDLLETRHRSDERELLSSQFIELLAEKLKEE